MFKIDANANAFTFLKNKCEHNTSVVLKYVPLEKHSCKIEKVQKRKYGNNTLEGPTLFTHTSKQQTK